MIATRKHHVAKHTRPSATSCEDDAKTREDASISTSYSVIKKTLNDKLYCRNNLIDKQSLSSTSLATTTTSTQPTTRQSKQDASLTPTAITCMALLALQFGIQPILVRKFTPQTINRSSVVLIQEVVKFGIAGSMYWAGTGKEKRVKDFEGESLPLCCVSQVILSCIHLHYQISNSYLPSLMTGWSIKTWITLAGLPAFLYTIQNISSLMAYQNLEALTFNVLNQTKILSAALSCYFVMGKRQSKMQVVSLLLLTLSTLVIEKILHLGSIASLLRGGGVGGVAFGLGNAVKGMAGSFSSLGALSGSAGRRFTHGIVPILAASLISGMAGALTQLNLQGGGSSKPIWDKRSSRSSDTSVSTRPPRNAYLFSMEMNVASIIFLLGSLFMSADGRAVLRSPTTFFSNWTPQTFIPVVTNAIGGILVGLVTKHAGSVRKGFALIFGLLLSGIFQANGSGIRSEQIVGGLMAAVSLWMHTVHPYTAPPSSKSVKK